MVSLRVAMARLIQIRNVPDLLHRRLKSRAALAGMSLSEYLLAEIREVAERPTIEELRHRLEGRSRAPVARKVGLIQQSYVGLLIERHLDDFVGLEIEL